MINVFSLNSSRFFLCWIFGGGISKQKSSKVLDWFEFMYFKSPRHLPLRLSIWGSLVGSSEIHCRKKRFKSHRNLKYDFRSTRAQEILRGKRNFIKISSPFPLSTIFSRKTSETRRVWCLEFTWEIAALRVFKVNVRKWICVLNCIIKWRCKLSSWQGSAPSRLAAWTIMNFVTRCFQNHLQKHKYVKLAS